jgi:hypothetical protein
MWIQHIQKALNEMNLHLYHVLTDISGQSGLAILDAILAGGRNPENLPRWPIIGSRKASPNRSGAVGRLPPRIALRGQSNSARLPANVLAVLSRT